MNTTDPENPIPDDSLPGLSAVYQKIEFTPGMKVGQYVLEQKIGAGGMGTVYLARHARLTSRFYAIKFIRPDLVSNDIRMRFEAEIDALEKIRHQNFVFAHDAGEFRNVTYLVMEYINGLSLSQLVQRNGPLPVECAAEIIRQAANGLQHAYEQELVHRDIKPSNLLMSVDGIVKILDLGLARFVNPESNLGLTASYQILGTPDYMSPEQCRSAANVDIRSDIYGLGCTLYRLVAGRAPFADEKHSSIANKIAGHLAEDPMPIQELTAEKLPANFVAIVKKMMAKDPDQRYQTPDEVRKAIETFASNTSVNSLDTASSIDLSAHTVTKSFSGPSVATREIEAPAVSPSEEKVAKPLQALWIAGALVLATLGAAIWGMPRGEDTANGKVNSDPVVAQNTNESGAEEPESTVKETLDAKPEPTEVVVKPADSPAVKAKNSAADSLVKVDPTEKAEPLETPAAPDTKGKVEPAKATKRIVPKPSDQQLASQVKQIFRSQCSECHGPERTEADLNVLDWASFVGEDGSVVPEDADESNLFERIATDDEDYRMPELPMEALSQSEIETVRQWIEVGAPEFPADVEPPKETNTDVALKNVVGAEYVLTQITDFIEGQARTDRPYFRFFSSNHLLMSGATKEELKEQHQALAKAINHLTMQPRIVRPTIVDEGVETIFAVDIRKLGWQQKLLTEVEGDREVRKSNMDLFDLVLLEYPYGIVFEDSTIYDQLWERFIDPSNMVRPVPFIRIDWFVSTATQFPLYEDLLQIPHQLSELEEILGVESEMNMESFVAKRAGMTVSGVSQNNRVVERHPSRFGAYWKSYDFETSRGRQNMFVDPMNFHFAGGEMVFNLPNGLQGYLITDTQGNRINEAPTGIVTDKFAADKTVRNGLACMRCHDRGVKRFVDNIRSAIEDLPGSSMANKRDVLRIYPTKDEMDQLLDADEKKFMDALTEALGEAQEREPLTNVARTFMDNAISLPRAASELGVREPDDLKRIFGLPQFVRFGLAGLSGDHVIRRDSWNDYIDRIVAELGIGVPITPVDGLIREDHLADALSSSLVLKTNKRTNIFSPGNEMVISVENKTGVDQFIELVGTSVHGKKVILTDGVVKLMAGETYRFPETGALKVEPKLGTESISLYANPEPYGAGKLLRGENIADRFVHDFYLYDPEGDGPTVRNNPTRLIKKTIKMQTK
jgi:serine/threonine-protein kinase